VQDGRTGAAYATLDYKPSGVLNSMAQGTGVSQTFSWNDRVQPVGVTVTGGGQPLLTLGLSPCAGGATACGSGNNGSLQSQTITVPGSSAWNQRYTYDHLNRLTGAADNGGASWTQSYGYDPLGNRWVNPGGTGLPSLTLETPQAANWYSATIPNRLAAWTYDNAGNVTHVGGMARDFAYDAENRQDKCSEPLSVFDLPFGIREGRFVLSDLFSSAGESSTFSAAFQEIYPPTPLPQVFDSLGSCVVGHGEEIAGFGRLLDAGSSLSLASPGAPLALTESFPGNYSGTLGARPTGSYTLTNGVGGVDVGPFSANFSAPAQLFTWSSPSVAAAPIDRTQPLTFQWTGGDPNGEVLIGFSASYGTASNHLLVSASCRAVASNREFPVPPNVLLHFPADLSGFTSSNVSVSVSGYAGLQLLSIPALDLAYATTVVSSSAPVTFK